MYLLKGVIHLRNVIQTALDKRLGMWEKYCLRHCFAVPQGFSLERNVCSLPFGIFVSCIYAL